jgi:hypothetical protein
MGDTGTVSGHITIVQEDRFRLVTDDGQGFLFTLSAHGSTTPADLLRFLHAGTHLEIEYSGIPGLENCVVRKVRPSGLSTRQAV